MVANPTPTSQPSAKMLSWLRLMCCCRVGSSIFTIWATRGVYVTLEMQLAARPQTNPTSKPRFQSHELKCWFFVVSSGLLGSSCEVFLSIKIGFTTRPQQAQFVFVGVELLTRFLPYFTTRPQRDYQTFASLKIGYLLLGGELLGLSWWVHIYSK